MACPIIEHGCQYSLKTPMSPKPSFRVSKMFFVNLAAQALLE